MCGYVKDTDGNDRLQWQTGSDDAHLDVDRPRRIAVFVGVISKSLCVWLYWNLISREHISIDLRESYRSYR